MKITVFNGSHKGRSGNTFLMVEAFLAGAREAGAEGEQVVLATHDIAPCRACMACWKMPDTRCVHRDAMDELLPKVIASDVFGLATPLYVDNVTGLMKTFLDRLVPIADPRWEQDDRGECRHRQRFPKPGKLIGIANCGFPEQSHFQVLALLLRRMARNLHCDLAAEIYRGAGGLLSHSDSAIQPAIDDYLQLVRRAGKELVEYGRVLEATSTQLERPLLPVENFSEEYMKRVNCLWGEQGA